MRSYTVLLKVTCLAFAGVLCLEVVGVQDRGRGLHAFAEGIAEDFRRALMQRFDSDLARSILKEHSLPFRELMAYYRCALMEVETKFRVLNEDLSLDSEQNPIEGIESRLKSVESILEKPSAKGLTSRLQLSRRV